MKNFPNPLFESLIFKANVYGMIDEQTDPAKDPKVAIFKDFARSLALIGSKLVVNYVTAISSYPNTELKAKYYNQLPEKLGKIAEAVNPLDNISAQMDALLAAVTKELQEFLAASQQDGVYAKPLAAWRNALRDGFSSYKLAIGEAKKYMEKTYPKVKDEKIDNILNQAILDMQGSLKDEIGKEKEFTDGREKINASLSTEEYGNKGIIEKLVDKKVAVDFNTFVSLSINEGAKGEAKDKAKKLLVSINSTLGSIDGVLNQIYVKEADPRRKDFKSIQMKPTFAQIAADINDVKDQITVDGTNLKSRKELVDLPLDDLTSTFEKSQELFLGKKDEYIKTSTTEEEGLTSIKTLDVQVPEINKMIGQGDGYFERLFGLANNAGQIAAEESSKQKDAKPAEKKAEVASALKIKGPIKKGTKSEEVKAFQQLVVDKMKDLKGNATFDNLAAASKQFGNFGGKTAAAVKFLKAGFGIKDNTSDITQELIDKISSHDGKIIGESFSLFEEFDLKAAKAAVSGAGNKMEKKKEMPSIKDTKKDLSSVKKEIAKDVPKLPAEDVKKQIDDAVKKAKEEWSKDQAIKELREIGAKENPDYGKNGQMAVATATGIRFYSNNVALRQFDKMLGTYSIKNDSFIGNDGSKDKLTSLMKDGIPYKYADAFRSFFYNPSDACKKYITWDEQSVSILNAAFKAKYKKSLDKHLAGALSSVFSGVDDNIDAFRKKFVKVLS